MHQFYQETEEKAEEKGRIKSVRTAEPQKKRNRRGTRIKIRRYLPLRAAEVSECSFNNNGWFSLCEAGGALSVPPQPFIRSTCSILGFV